MDALPEDLTSQVAAGQLAYAWTDVGGRSSLVVGGQSAGTAASVYVIHDARTLESTLDQLRLALVVGTIALILVALVVARSVARGVLAPVEAASQAAERIEGGDLSARVPVTSDDEFGAWAERFNRMAEALGETIDRLEAAEAQNRRFVADVAHELRTPLAALVAEASILRDHLGALPDESRRAGELLVADVARLRTLVDDLMEISRFDAGAEQIAVEPVDVGRLVGSVVAARLPVATVSLPEDLPYVETDPRRLERILGNLLDNAREHAAGTPVEVRVETSPDDLVISVADRGPGVASADVGPAEELVHGRSCDSGGLGHDAENGHESRGPRLATENEVGANDHGLRGGR